MRDLRSCPYCYEDWDGCVMALEKNGHAFVRREMNDGWCIVLQAKGWHGKAKIRFCPMCGRELTQ